MSELPPRGGHDIPMSGTHLKGTLRSHEGCGPHNKRRLLL